MFTLHIGHKMSDDAFGWPIDAIDSSRPVVEVELPATTYELLELFEKAELDAESKIYVYGNSTVFNYHLPKIECIEEVVILNEAAHKMSDMDDIGLTALVALVQRESDGWKHKISTSRLYDLACSVNQCEVIPEIEDIRELGRYYVKNDLIPEVKDLGESLKKALNYDYLGLQVANETKGA